MTVVRDPTIKRGPLMAMLRHIYTGALEGVRGDVHAGLSLLSLTTRFGLETLTQHLERELIACIDAHCIARFGAANASLPTTTSSS